MNKDTLYQDVIESAEQWVSGNNALSHNEVIRIAQLIELRRIADIIELNHINEYGGSLARVRELKERQS
jgi:hypothetical protein